MTPERATELLNHKTELFSPFGDLIMRGKTIEIGNIRKHMSAEEINEVNRLWETLPGTASFYSTLLRISKS